MIKILLAEDHNLVRNGIRSLLEKEEDIEVIAEAANGNDVLQILKEEQKPDILLTAINMPQMDGIELLTQVHALYPIIKVVMLSSLNGDSYIIKAFKAGAMGYMLKSVNESELLFGLRHIHTNNERYLCNEIALYLLEKLLHTRGNKFDIKIDDIEISEREIEILSLLAGGFTNQEIADKMFTSKRTIEGQRQLLIEKTGTRNTAELIRYAVLNGIVN